MSDFLIVFLGVSAAIPCVVLVFLATRRRPEPSYRNPDYDPQAQRLPREPQPLPAHGNARQFALFSIEAGLIHEDRANAVHQVKVSAEDDTVVITGGKGVRELVKNAARYGAFGSGPCFKMRVVEDPTLGKREEWSWTGSRLDQVPPSSRWMYEED